MYYFMSGKIFDLYMTMLNQLKLPASKFQVTLPASNIKSKHCDFKIGAILYKLAFPGLKISGFHLRLF